MTRFEPKQLWEHIDKQSIKVCAPEPVLFVCGGPVNPVSNKPVSLRDAYFRIHSEHFPTYAAVKAEEALGLFDDVKYKTLIDFERLLSEISTLVLVFLESAGSIAELGFFATDKRIVKKTYVITTETLFNKNSFIKSGLFLNLIDYDKQAVLTVDDNLVGIDSFCHINKLFSLEAFTQEVVEPLRERLSREHKSEQIVEGDNSHITRLIVGIIQQYEAIELQEIRYALSRLVTSTFTESTIKQYLHCAEIVGWIANKRLGHQAYYFSNSDIDFIDFDLLNTTRWKGKQRYRLGIQQFWRDNDKARYRAITKRSRRSQEKP